MNIGSYYIRKKQILTFIILVIGLVLSVYLALNRQIFRSKASTTNRDFEISQGISEPRTIVACEGNVCTTNSLEIFIKPKLLDNEPTGPVKAVIKTPSVNPQVSIDPSLGYYIPFRDSSINIADPQAVKNHILNSWPKANIDAWDHIISRSQNAGWNPTFVIALWIEESGAQGAFRYSAALGCDVNQTKYSGTDIDQQLNCLFRNADYPNEQFADFMCIWGGDGFHKAPCTFNQSNPHFPENIRRVYSELVPSGRGAVVR